MAQINQNLCESVTKQLQILLRKRKIRKIIVPFKKYYIGILKKIDTVINILKQQVKYVN